MSRKRPTLFFAFANDPRAPLRLGEEQNACAKALAALHDNETIEYYTTGYSTLEAIYDSLDRFHDRLYVFHFGGHSNGQGLQLADTSGRAESLATILGQQKKLKLVFLNGCANAGQVEVLWDKGVRAVIATSAAVDDKRALELANRFYQALASRKTISEAFDTAVSFVRNSSEIEIGYIYRGADLGGASSPAFPWGLYVQDNAVLDWHIGMEDDHSRRDEDAARAVNRRLLKEVVRKDRSFAFWQRWFFLPGKGRKQELALKALNLFDTNEIQYFQQTLRRYLPLYYRDSNGRTANFLDSLFKELNDERPGRKYYLLMGETGAGKTTALLNLFIRFATAKRRYGIVFAPIRHLYSISSLDDKEKEKAVLLLDGIDEAPEAFRDADAFFKHVEDKAKNFAKVVISCRSQFFVGQAAERRKTNTKPANEYTRIHLDLLEIEAVRKEVGQLFSIEKENEKYRTALSIIAQSGKLFNRPLLLPYIRFMVENKDHFLFLDLRAESMAATISAYEIYHIVIQEWVERERRQDAHFTGDYREALLECSLKLAQFLYEHDTGEGKRYFHHTDLKRLVEKGHLPIGESHLRGRSLLHRNDKGYYRFAHRTFKEFFYAQLLYEGMLAEETFPFGRYEDAARFYREMCEVNYYQQMPKEGRRGHTPGQLDAALAGYSVPCIAVQTFCALRGLHPSGNVFELFALLTADAIRHIDCFIDLAEWVVENDMNEIPEENVLDHCDTYDLSISDLLDSFFFRQGQQGYSFLHRSFAEFFCLYDRIAETDEEGAREAALEFPFEKLRFPLLFEREINWLRLRQHRAELQILLDASDISSEDFFALKTENPHLEWPDYVQEKSRAKWPDYPDYCRRIRQSQWVRLRFLSQGGCGWLAQLPFSEQVKHLDLSHNDIQGTLDLSRFTQLESLDVSGNPSLSLADFKLPALLAQLILSDETPGSARLATAGRKFPHIAMSRNGNQAFTLPQEPFREPDMVEVKGGAFWMGSEEDDAEARDDEKPLHLVRLSDYSIGKYPVTTEEFAHFVKETGYVTAAEREGWSICNVWQVNTLTYFCKVSANWRHDVYGKPMGNTFARFPVVHVSWEDAAAYCAWLSRKTGKLCTLPTEAQWEYAAIGGHRAARKDGSGACRRAFTYAGSDTLPEVGWYFDKFKGLSHSQYGLRPAGALSPNELGLYDMSGNVWEWCRDWHDARYYQLCQAQGAPENPSGPETGTRRVLRGGSWAGDAAHCRSADRYAFDPALRYAYFGFRLVFVPQFGG